MFSFFLSKGFVWKGYLQGIEKGKKLKMFVVVKRHEFIPLTIWLVWKQSFSPFFSQWRNNNIIQSFLHFQRQKHFMVVNSKWEKLLYFYWVHGLHRLWVMNHVLHLVIRFSSLINCLFYMIWSTSLAIVEIIYLSTYFSLLPKKHKLSKDMILIPVI